MKSSRQKTESKNSSIGRIVNDPYEKEFSKFLQKFINTRESVEDFINSAISRGKTRHQAIAQLNSHGIYLKYISK